MINISKFEITKSHGRYPYWITLWLEKSFIRKIFGMKKKKISFTGYHGMWFDTDTTAMVDSKFEIILNDILDRYVST